MRRPKALTIAAFGAKGTGKTVWCKRMLAASGYRRVMVWDFKSDFDLREIGTMFVGVSQWSEFVSECGRKDFIARYVPDQDFDLHEQFDAFCALAWREGNLLMFVDELAEVTRAAKAPPAWRKVVNVGRSYDGGRKSIAIIGASQRPNEVDKSFVGNADIVHTGRLGNAAEARALAALWGINAAELAGLPDLHYIEKRADSPDVSRGVLTFDKKPAARDASSRAPKGRSLRR